VAHTRLPAAAVVTALVFALQPLTAVAQNQSNPGWFVPNQHPAARAVAPGPRAVPPAAPIAGEPPLGAGQPVPQQIQVQLPPMPKVPDIPKGSPPPAAIIGILNVPAVLQLSKAYQDAVKEMRGREQSLNDDRQKEERSLNELSHQLATDRSKLSPEQIRQKERQFQDRVTESRRKFGERARVIQESEQYVWLQIERAIDVVAQQVANARGINVVLNRAQVLGATPEFDLSPEVAKVVNEMLPKVDVPPPGESPLKLHPVKPASEKESSDKVEKKAAPAKTERKH